MDISESDINMKHKAKRYRATFYVIRAVAAVTRSIMFHVLARHARRLEREAGWHFQYPTGDSRFTSRVKRARTCTTVVPWDEITGVEACARAPGLVT